jgi:hypothetical protein
LEAGAVAASCFSGLLSKSKRLQRAIFSGVAVRAGIRMNGRQNGSVMSRFIYVAISLHLGFDNSQTNRLRGIEIFCWTRTAFFETLAT